MLLLTHKTEKEQIGFKSIAYAGIKGRSGMYPLKTVTVVTGPNGSGKTAFTEAMRLAATGTARIGNAKHRQGELLPSFGNGMCAIRSNETLCEWRGSRKSGKVSTDWTNPVNSQGDMPASVDDFLSMTAEERWTMLSSGDDTIAKLDASIEALSVEISKLGRTINQPTPHVESYSGEPEWKLRQDLDSINLKINRHLEARSKAAAIKNSTNTMQTELTVREWDQTENELLLKSARESLAGKKQKLDYARSLRDAEKQAISSIPDSIKGMLGGSGKDALSQVIKQYVDCIAWLSNSAESTGGEIQGRRVKILASVVCDPDLSNIDDFQVAWPTHSQSAAIEVFLEEGDYCSIDDACSALSLEVENLKKSVQLHTENQTSLLYAVSRINASLAANANATAGLLEDSEYNMLVQESERMQGQLDMAINCAAIETLAKQIADQRAEAIVQLEEASRNQARLRSEKSERLKEIKGAVQDWVNTRLESAGWGKCEINATTTGKRSQLTITTSNGVDISATPDSLRLAIWSLIVSAIHEFSEAPMPLLVIEAAEMDVDGLAKLCTAHSCRTKGNVLIAHWQAPKLENDKVVVIEL